ncbi:MAG TPA: hypothetical protein VN612_08265 [Acidobacteriaceae bacterium]|nr:hypothetical protein [Acidobacteriaceae bacterium]
MKVAGETAAFDLQHDKDTDGGGSLFCRLGITASQADRAISNLKMAVAAPSSPSVTKILRFPVEIVVYDGNRKNSTVMLHTKAEWVEFVRDRLNSRQKKAIGGAKLSDMMIVDSKGAGPGFILGDGLVFFSTRNPHHIVVWHLNTEVLAD